MQYGKFVTIHFAMNRETIHETNRMVILTIVHHRGIPHRNTTCLTPTWQIQNRSISIERTSRLRQKPEHNQVKSELVKFRSNKETLIQM